MLRTEMDLWVVAGPVANQDFGEPIDLSDDPVDLAVFGAADRDLGLGPGQDVAGWSQGLQKLFGDLLVHDPLGLSRVTVLHANRASCSLFVLVDCIGVARLLAGFSPAF
jgi:hypothetical protein